MSHNIWRRWVTDLFRKNRANRLRKRVRRPLGVEILEDRVVPATDIWTGGGNGITALDWSNVNNWSLGRAPIAGDDIVFNSTTAGNKDTFDNDSLATGASFNSITFNASGYSISGTSKIYLSGPLSASANLGVTVATGEPVISDNIEFAPPSSNPQQNITVGSSTVLDLALPGAVSGNSSAQTIFKTGTGELELDGNNSGYTGAWNLSSNGGTVLVTNGDALGTGAAVSGDPYAGTATVNANATIAVQGGITVPEQLILNGPGATNNGAILNANGANTWSGTVVMDSNSFFGSTAGNLSFSNVISDAGSGFSLTKVGAGTVTFSHVGGNTYRGQTVIDNGILAIQDPLSLGAGANASDTQNGTLGSETIVNYNSSNATFGTLELHYVNGTIPSTDPNAILEFPALPYNQITNPIVGFQVFNDLLVLNGPGADPQAPGDSASSPVGTQQFGQAENHLGAIYNAGGNNGWDGNVTLGGIGSSTADPVTTFLFLNPLVGFLTGERNDVFFGAAANSTLSISGVIGNGTSLNGTSPPVVDAPLVDKVQPGRVVFTDANTYTGGTEVDQGDLEITDSKALGTGSVTVGNTYIWVRQNLQLSATLPLGADVPTGGSWPANSASLELGVDSGLDGTPQRTLNRNLGFDSVTGSGETLGQTGQGINSLQEIAIPTGTTAGTFTLSFTFNGVTDTTLAQAYNVSASALQTALNGLTTIAEAGGVTVTLSGSTYLVLFKGTTINVPLMGFTPTGITGATLNAATDVQEIYVSSAVTSGTFTVSFSYGGIGSTTTALPYNVSAAALQSALNLLTSVKNAGGVSVTQDGTVYRVYFNSLTNNVPLLSYSSTTILNTAATTNIAVNPVYGLIVSNPLTITGTGLNSEGALNSLSGINIYKGAIALGNELTIEKQIQVAGTYDIYENYDNGYAPAAPTPVTSGSIGVELDSRPGHTTADNSYLTYDYKLFIPNANQISGQLDYTFDKYGAGQLVIEKANAGLIGPTTIDQGWITVEANNALGLANPEPTLSELLQPDSITVDSGASLQLLPPAGTVLTLGNNLILSGVGLPATTVTTPGINFHMLTEGSLLSLGGNNILSGTIQLDGTGSIGVDDPILTDLPSESTLTTTGEIEDYQDPLGGTTSGGLDKLGQRELIVQGPGTYTGSNVIVSGTLLLQNDTGLGLDSTGTFNQSDPQQDVYSTSTTSVETGALLELGDADPTVNGGVPASVQVWNESLALYGGGQQLNISGTGGTFQLVYTDPNTGTQYKTAPINVVSATQASDIQNALNAILPSGDSVLVIPTEFGAASFVGLFTVIFEGALATLSVPLLTVIAGAAPGNGTVTVSGSPYPIYATADNEWDGGVTLNEPQLPTGSPPLSTFNSTIEVANNSRLTIAGTVSDASIASANGSSLTLNAAINSSSTASNDNGDLVLSGSNTYRGTTYVNAGILTVANNQALGAQGMPELQDIAVNESSGSFTLAFNGYTTGPLNAASPTLSSDIQTALNNLLSIAGVGGSVSVASSTTLGDNYVVTFGGGGLDGFQQNLITSSTPATVSATELQAGYGGTIVSMGSQMQVEGNLTIAGEQLELAGTGQTAATTPTSIPLTWDQVGPSPIDNGQTGNQNAVSGIVTGIATDPSDSNVIYIATAGGGAWRTINHGLTWTPLFDGVSEIQQITVNTTNPFTLTFNGQTTGVLSSAGVSEIQTITVNTASTYNFTLTYDGLTTGNIVSTSGTLASDIQTALNLLAAQLTPIGGTFTVATVSPGVFTITFGGSFVGYAETLITTNQPTKVSIVQTQLGNANLALDIQNALDGLSSIGGKGGSVAVTQSGNVYTVTFGGQFTNLLEPLITPSASLGAGSIVQIQAGAGANVALFSGAIAVDPQHVDTIYLGTGEANNSVNSYYGTGVYVTYNYGQTWSLLVGAVFDPQKKTALGNAVDPMTFDFHNSTNYPGGAAVSAIVVDPTHQYTIYVSVSDEAVNDPMPIVTGPLGNLIGGENAGVWRYIGTGPAGTNANAGNANIGWTNLTTLVSFERTYGASTVQGKYAEDYAAYGDTYLAHELYDEGTNLNPNPNQFAIFNLNPDPLTTKGANFINQFPITASGFPTTVPKTAGPDDNWLVNFPVDGVYSDVTFGSTTIPLLAYDAYTGQYDAIESAGVPALFVALGDPTGPNDEFYNPSPFSGGFDNAVYYLVDPFDAQQADPLSGKSGEFTSTASPPLSTPPKFKFGAEDGLNVIWGIGDGNPWTLSASGGTNSLTITNDFGNESTSPGTAGAFPLSGQFNPFQPIPDSGNIKISSVGETIYASIATSIDDVVQPSQLDFVYVSTNGGLSWVETGSQPTSVLGLAANGTAEGWFGNSITVDPSDPKEVFVMGDLPNQYPDFSQQIFESANGGASWIDISTDAGGNGPGDSQLASAIDADGNLLVGDSGGIWEYNTNLGEWLDLNGNLAISNIEYVATQPGDPQVMLAGGQSIGTELYDPAVTGASPQAWLQTEVGNGFAGAFVPGNPEIAYTVSNGFVLKSTNGGVTFNANPIYFSDSENTPLAVDPINPNRVVVGGALGLVESTDQGATFDNLNAPITATAIALATYQGEDGANGTFVPDPSFPDVTDQGANTYVPGTIYITDGTNIFVTKNDGQSWSANRTTGISLTQDAPATAIVALVVDPANEDNVFAVVQNAPGGIGAVYESTNAGQTWTNITKTSITAGTLTNSPFWTMTIDPRTETLYLGTDVGVFSAQMDKTAPASTSWSRFGNGMPEVQVTDLDLDMSTDTLTASTYGRSIYQIRLDNPEAGSGALRVAAGTSVWAGPIIMTGKTDIQVDGVQTMPFAQAQLDVTGTISDVTYGADFTLTKSDVTDPTSGINFGQGTLIFSGNNVYGGVTVVDDGALVANSYDALGTNTTLGVSVVTVDGTFTSVGTTVEDGAALELDSNLDDVPVTLIGNGILFNDHYTGALRNIISETSFSGTIYLVPDATSDTTTIGADSGTEMTLTGQITSLDPAIGNLVKEGTGTVVLNNESSTNPNNYTGKTYVYQGALQAQTSNAFSTKLGAVDVLDGAQVQLQDAQDIQTITLSGGVTSFRLSLGGIPSLTTLFANSPTLAAQIASVLNALLVQAGDSGGVVSVLENATGVFTVLFGGTLFGVTENPTTQITATQVAPASATVTTLVEQQGGPVAVANPLTISGMGTDKSGALVDTGGANSWTGAITFAVQPGFGPFTTPVGTVAIGADYGDNLTLTGAIGDEATAASANGTAQPLGVIPISLEKVGAGIVTMPTTTTNSYTGMTEIQNGILDLQNPNALGQRSANYGPTFNTVQEIVTEDAAAASAVADKAEFTISFGGKSEQFAWNTSAAKIAAAFNTGGLFAQAGQVVTVNETSIATTTENTVPAVPATPQGFLYTITFSGTDADTTTPILVKGLNGVNAGSGIVSAGGVDVQVDSNANGVGELALDSTTGLTVSASHEITLNGDGPAQNAALGTESLINASGDGALFNYTGNNTWAGPINLASASQIGVAAGTTLTLTGATTSGNGSALAGTIDTLEKVDPGMLIYSTTGTFPGEAIVSAGDLQADGHVGTVNGVVFNGGTLSGTGTVGVVTTDASGNGGTIDPGDNSSANPIGTLNSVGSQATVGNGVNLSLKSVNTYEVAPAPSDLYSPSANDIGDSLHVTGGTNWTTGTYQIVGFDSTTGNWIVSGASSPSAGATSGGTWTLYSSTNFQLANGIDLTLGTANTFEVAPASPDTYTPTSADIGRDVLINGGTGWTKGTYSIVGFDSTSGNWIISSPSTPLTTVATGGTWWLYSSSPVPVDTLNSSDTLNVDIGAVPSSDLLNLSGTGLSLVDTLSGTTVVGPSLTGTVNLSVVTGQSFTLIETDYKTNPEDVVSGEFAGAQTTPLTTVSDPLGLGLTAYGATIDWIDNEKFVLDYFSDGVVATRELANVTLSISDSISNPVYSQDETFTVSMTKEAGAPGVTGTVVFTIGTLGSYSVTSTTPTNTYTFDYAAATGQPLPVGTYVVSASYNGNNSNGVQTFNVTNSPITLSPPVTVGLAPTTTTLTSSVGAPVYGQPVTFTAVVSTGVNSPVGGTEAPGFLGGTGTVSFYDGGTLLHTVPNSALTVVNGTGGVYTATATFMTSPSSPLSVGTHTITAVFSGDGNYATSTSTTFTVIVNEDSTTTHLSYSPAPPATLVFGQAVTFTASVTANSPGTGTITSGTVTFERVLSNQITVDLDTVTLNGTNVAVYTSSPGDLPVGSNNIEAIYNGDATPDDYLESSATKSVTVGTDSTLTAFTGPTTTVVYGQPATFSVNITALAPGGGIPTGTVDFYSVNTTTSAKTLLGPGTVNTSGVATFSTSPFQLAVGNTTISATYQGDSNFTTSSTTTDVIQTVDEDDTTTSLSSSVSGAVTGQQVTFTATVVANPPGSGLPTGTVTFVDQTSGQTLGSTSLVVQGGLNEAVITVPATVQNLPGGTDTIVADYSGIPEIQTVTVNTTSSYNFTLTFNGDPTTTLSNTDATLAHDLQTALNNLTSIGGVGGIATVTQAGNVFTVTFGGALVGYSQPLITTSAPANVTIAQTQGVDFFPSTGETAQLVGSDNAAVTVLSSATKGAVYGQPVTFTADVTPAGLGSGTPAGTVNFYINGSLLNTSGPIALVNGLATDTATLANYNASQLQVGSGNVITVDFQSSNSQFNSNNGTLSPNQTVNPDATTTLVSSAGPSAYGTPATFYATVTSNSPGGGAPQGTMNFYLTVNGSLQLLNTSGPVLVLNSSGNSSTFAFSTTSTELPLGTNQTITAVFNDTDGNYLTSTGATTQTVGHGIVTVGVTATWPGQPGLDVYGEGVTFTTTLTPTVGTALPTGTVTYSTGNTVLAANVPVTDVNGVATAISPAITQLPLGTDTITATYSGDSNYASTSETINQSIVQDGSTTSLLALTNNNINATDINIGQAIVLSATVAPNSPGGGIPTGVVTFVNTSANNAILGTASINSSGVANLQTSFAAVGTVTIQADYNGTAQYGMSSSNLISEIVSAVGTRASKVTVVSSQNPSFVGSLVTFTATVKDAGTGATKSLTGTVSFMANGNLLGYGTLVTKGGVTAAVYTTTASQLPLVNSTSTTYSIVAVYNGNANYEQSPSAAISQVVNPLPTRTSSVSVTSSSPTSNGNYVSNYGQSVTFTATVTDTGPTPAQTPTGTVVFSYTKANSNTLLQLGTGTLSLVNGVPTATFSTSALGAGTYYIVATYNGNTVFETETSAQITQIVNPINTKFTTFKSSANPSVFGQAVTLTATVKQSSGGVTGAAASGNVTFTDTTTGLTLATVALNASGVATYTTSALAVGNHAIVANFIANGNLGASQSQTLTQVVNQASVTETLAASTANANTALTLTATIKVASPGAGTPTGTVTFIAVSSSGVQTDLGTGTVGTNGKATFTVAAGLPAGTYTIYADYSGDNNFAADDYSKPFTFKVGRGTGG